MKIKFVLIAIISLSTMASFHSFARDKNDLVHDILNQTNQFRRAKGLSNLTIREELNAIAQQHSEDMAKGRVAFGHGGFEERNNKAGEVIKHMHDFAENVAYGPTSGREVVSLWKNSPGHRRNMLGHYKYIGIGTAKDSQGRIYYTEVFAG